MSGATFAKATDRWAAIAAAHEGPHAGLRAAALRDFSDRGFPDTRVEEWRYTNLTSVIAEEHALSLEPVHVEIGREEGVSVAPLRSDPAPGLGELIDLKSHPVAALNTALLGAGTAFSVESGAHIAEPINITFPTLRRAQAHAARVLGRIGANATARIRIGEAPADETCWRNDVVELFLEPGAVVEFVFHKSGRSASTSTVAIHQASDSQLLYHAVTLEGAFTRQDLAVTLAGEGASCRLRSLFGTSEGGVCDHHTVVDHAVPHGSSDQLYKGVVSGTGRGVFRGRVVVRPDAQKTQALQSNPNLLLDERAEVDTKPQLEIYADDVRCTHGATIGQLDAEALYYLRTRGIDPQEAGRLLVRGFAAEALAEISDDSLRERLLESSLAQLGAAL